MINKIRLAILTVTIFLFPLFYLAATQDYFTRYSPIPGFATNKLYLLALAATLLFLTSSIEIMLSKKIVFPKKSPLYILTLVIILFVALYIVIISTNKVEAILNPNFGLLAVLSLSLISFYIRSSRLNLAGMLSLSSLILSLTTIFFFFQDSLFSSIGTQLDLAAFLGFCLLVQLLQTKGKSFFNQITFALTTAGFVLAVSSLFSAGLANFQPVRPSLMFLFIFFTGLSYTPLASAGQHDRHPKGVVLIDLKQKPFFYLIPLLLIVSVAITSYLIGRSYLAEFYFKKSLAALAKKNIKETYDNQRLAIIANPFIERFRISFSQTNLLIANSTAQKAAQQPNNQQLTINNKYSDVLSSQDRQTISQAIQAAIEEGKAVVRLNDQKASNWENLASIYRNLINTAEGADTWAISSYQRALVLDPQNAKYRVDLGGVYYLLKNYGEARRLFEQATVLKPDWPNAHYNLAWAYFQKGNYKKAISSMQTVISLLNRQKNSADLNKAKKDLKEFNLKLNE